MMSVLFSLFAAASAAAPLPYRIPFQGKLLDPATNLPRNGVMSMTFKIYDAPSGGAAKFTETQSVSVLNGVFAVQIGTAATLSPDLFSGASAYLGVTVPPDAEMTPRQPLGMSPWSFTAAQLAQSGDIRVNAGTSYSTFTTGGNLQVPYGVSASTFTGDGADLVKVRVDLSSSGLNANNVTVAATEEVAITTSIVPSRSDSRFLIFATAGLNRTNNNFSTWTIRIRRNVGSACGTGSTQVGLSNFHTVPNTAGSTETVTVFKVDDPNTTSEVFYCLTLASSGAQSYDERTIIVQEVAP
jgi:hypothetical protein